MKIKHLLLLVFFISFSNSNAQYHLDQLPDSLKVYLKEGWKCWNETEEGSCIPYYQKFFDAVKESGECLPCAEIELARIYSWEGYPKKSIKHSMNVLKDAQKIEGRLRYELESDAYNEIGNNYKELGNLEKALEFQLKSLKVKDEIEKYDKQTAQQYKAINKFNIGGIYGAMNDCKNAIKYQKETFYELTALKNNRTCQVADGISGEYINCKEIDSAKVWAFRTISLSEKQKIGNQFEASAYARLAEIYKAQQPDSALFYINKALKFENSENLRLQTARIYISKGRILSRVNQYTEAQNSFQKAENLLPENASIDLLYLYENWGNSAYEHQDFATASNNLVRFIKLNDSVNSQQTQKTVRELNTKYETEKKERQLAEQQLEIQQQKSKKLTAVFAGVFALCLSVAGFVFIQKNHKSKLRRIQQEKENAILNAFILGEERERNRISHELHDGVAAMIGAAKMSLETLPHLPKDMQEKQFEKVGNILENIHTDVRHIAHNLLPVTLEKEGLVKATREFVSEINQTNLLDIEVIDDNSKVETLSKQLQLLLFRIIQELVNNIIKHSQAQKATITFGNKGDMFEINVSDNGTGYQEDNKTKGQGLFSIDQRLKAIGGTFKIVKQQNNKGSKAIVKLKLS